MAKRTNYRILMQRTKYQGLVNVLKFNLPKYLLGLLFGLLGIYLLVSTENEMLRIIGLISQTSWLLMALSLIVSHWIYDISPLYSLDYLKDIPLDQNSQIVNISAGFDEIGDLLKDKYPKQTIEHLDIFKSLEKRETSIKIARKQNPKEELNQVLDFKLPLESNSKDLILLFFAAHEIREHENRILFFEELKRILKPGGRILLTEHQRDFYNFVAYTFGFFHFFSQKTWLDLFKRTGFQLNRIRKENPWVKTFNIQKT